MTATVIERYTLHGLSAPKVITSETQHDQYVSVLLKLEQQAHLTPEERSYAELLTLLIESYEEKYQTIHGVLPLDVLRELMSANDLRQKDLLDVFGTESVVSEVLNGKRDLNKSHIEKLSKKFGVSPEVFF